jgi:hypothetical protein
MAARPATASVAEPADDATTLPLVRAAGLTFPYWEDAFGWRATGIRRDRVNGRALTTVFYRSHGRRIAYTIVSGASLAPGHGDVRAVTRHGVTLRAFVSDRRRVVTWLRRGQTCVLSGVGVPAGVLLKLAAWRAHGALAY